MITPLTHRPARSANLVVAPCHDRAICFECCKGATAGEDLDDIAVKLLLKLRSINVGDDRAIFFECCKGTGGGKYFCYFTADFIADCAVNDYILEQDGLATSSITTEIINDRDVTPLRS